LSTNPSDLEVGRSPREVGKSVATSDGDPDLTPTGRDEKSLMGHFLPRYSEFAEEWFSKRDISLGSHLNPRKMSLMFRESLDQYVHLLLRVAGN
jgi:hypothetical protein